MNTKTTDITIERKFNFIKNYIHKNTLLLHLKLIYNNTN